ncbi:PilT/PilU family type 4a pilus ATPase [Ruminococcaceae bacterium OttesenSCG-928-N02]|nr:PilT/PilU family type 4a pilus ATPase [Ruminococcaceae bacterium OttesenSCG-928-N02]
MNFDLLAMLQEAIRLNASDIFIVAGLPITFKVSGKNHFYSEEKTTALSAQQLVEEICQLAGGRPPERMLAGDDDFSFALKGLSRFRVSTYRQRGSLAAVIRIITFDLPDPNQMGIPENVLRLGDFPKGMVLVTGPAGSGKSTTLACMIDRINSSRSGHIITLEDPLEFLHSHKKSIVSQREIPTDTLSYATALRASLRQAPDVILLGEMRDYETINIAMTAAETGHLVISTLHTIGAANTIDRIIDVFPPNQQRQIATQLATVLQAVVSQQLVPGVDGTLSPAFEVMIMTPAIRNMIREGKVHQIDSAIGTGANTDMIAMDTSLAQLLKAGSITAETALQYAVNPELFQKRYLS